MFKSVVSRRGFQREAGLASNLVTNMMLVQMESEFCQVLRLLETMHGARLFFVKLLRSYQSASSLVFARRRFRCLGAGGGELG